MLTVKFVILKFIERVHLLRPILLFLALILPIFDGVHVCYVAGIYGGYANQLCKPEMPTPFRATVHRATLRLIWCMGLACSTVHVKLVRTNLNYFVLGTNTAAIFLSNDNSLYAPITSNECHARFHLYGTRRLARSASKAWKYKMKNACPQLDWNPQPLEL